MSLDYPEYVVLKQRSRWLGFLWCVGDVGYYIGLLGAVAGPLLVFMLYFAALIRSRPHLGFWQSLAFAGIFFVAFAGIFLLSASLKVYARKKGGTYGIYS